MITLVVGTPDSGKSIIAEGLAVESGAEGRLIYLATMIAYDEEGQKRIARHRKQREGKGFVTIEQGYDIATLQGLDGNDTVLLECITNLVGNELYENTARYGDGLHKVTEITLDDFSEIIEKDITELHRQVKNLIIVTNSFEEEGYDEETVFYMRAVNRVNNRLQRIADKTVMVGKK